MNSISLENFHSKLIGFFNSQPESVDFKQPVQWKKLGLVDYLNVIKNPMSIAKINKKFNSIKYSTIKQMIADVELIWSNCRQYNEANSEIVKRANKLSQAFESFLKRNSISLPTKRKESSFSDDSDEKPVKKNKLQESDDSSENIDRKVPHKKSDTRKKNKLKESEDSSDYSRPSAKKVDIRRREPKKVSRQSSRTRPKPLSRSKSEKSEIQKKPKVLKQQKINLKKEEKGKNSKILKTEENSEDFQSNSSVKSIPKIFPEPVSHFFEDEGDSIKEEPTNMNSVSLNEDSEKGSVLVFKDVSIEKLVRLKEKIRETSMEMLCKVIRFIKKKNPEGLVRKDEKVVIKLEKLSYQVFHEVWNMIVGNEEALESAEDQ